MWPSTPDETMTRLEVPAQFFHCFATSGDEDKPLVALSRIRSVSNKLSTSSYVRRDRSREISLWHRVVWWVHFQLSSQCCPPRCARHGIWGCWRLTAASLHLANYITLICTRKNKHKNTHLFSFFHRGSTVQIRDKKKSKNAKLFSSETCSISTNNS